MIIGKLTYYTKEKRNEKFSDNGRLYNILHDLLSSIEIKECIYQRNDRSSKSESDNKSIGICWEEHANEESKQHHQCYDDKELYYEEEIFVHEFL
jgi:hypothetical protein